MGPTGLTGTGAVHFYLRVTVLERVNGGGDLFPWDAICFRPGAERENSDNSFRVGHFCVVAPDRRASVPTPNFCQDMAAEGRGLGLTVSAVATESFCALHVYANRMVFSLEAKVS